MLLVCVSLAALVSGVVRLFDLDGLGASRLWLHAQVAENPPRAVLVAVLLYVVCVVVSVPATLVLTMVGGFLFGTVAGALIALGSATTGALIVFTIGRSAARDVLVRRVGSRLGRLAEGFRRDAFGYIVVLRLLPIFPFWMTNLAPAAFGVPVRTFGLATLVGLTPGAFVYAGTGAGLEDMLAAHEAAKAACRARDGAGCAGGPDLRRLVTPKMVAGLGGLALFVLVTIGLRRRRAVRV